MIDQIILQIQQDMERPGTTLLTSDEMLARAHVRRSIATAIRLGGGDVKAEYRGLDEGKRTSKEV